MGRAAGWAQLYDQSLEIWKKGALLRLQLDRFPPNLLSYSISPGNGIPAQDKEQQGSRLCGAKVCPVRREGAMSQSQMQEQDAEHLCIGFDWWLACWISFGKILSSCDSPGSFLMGQIALGWENTSVVESFFHGNNCTMVCSAAEVAALWGGAGHPLLWVGLPGSARFSCRGWLQLWGNLAFHFYMKTYWVVITLSFPLFLAFIKIGVMKWLPQYIL